VAETILRVENLEKYFPPALSGWKAMLWQAFAPATVCALGGISFSANAGEVVALVGENGAGKSTLLRILSTLLIPTRGRAEIAGFDLEHQPGEVRCRIGLHTGSDASFYARLSAGENLRFFAAMNNLTGAVAARRIAEVVELMRLGSALDRQVRTLSTGTVHRLGLARALLHAPSLLMLDEPTRSLDPLAATEFRRFLRGDLVAKRGTSLLFASHSLAEVGELADRVALLHAGILVACETPAGLLRRTGASTLEEALEKLTPRGVRGDSA
jgi:ABC-2 type transport system ATP-binding protein